MIRNCSALGIVGLSACLLAGCGATRPAPAAPGVAGSSSGRAPACVSIQRGSAGAVQDARIAERWPDKNYGDQAASCAGKVGGSARETLLGFDLRSIPKSAVITRATITLQKSTGGAAKLIAHRVTAPWSEATVTWNRFAAAFDPAAAAVIETPDGDEPGAVSFDVTELAREWASDSASNHGLVLEQSESVAAFVTSESDVVHERPRIEICFAGAS